MAVSNEDVYSFRFICPQFANVASINRCNRNIRVLIEHGGADNRDGRDAISIADWQTEMDAEGIDWQFHTHARAPHGFALARGVWANGYTEEADRRFSVNHPFQIPNKKFL